MPSRRNSTSDRARRRADAERRAAERVLRNDDSARRIAFGKPNHFYHDSLGDPATCTGDHNHPPVSHMPNPPHAQPS